MARYTGPVCRLCRREGTKLFLKGSRCTSEACPFSAKHDVKGGRDRAAKEDKKKVKKLQAPGQHGAAAKKQKGYGVQFREKQKTRRYYGVLERQFENYYAEADRKEGVTGENLLVLLERRLDNVVYRAGLALSRKEARQLVLHGHFTVNGKKVNIPSFSVKPGDVIHAVASLTDSKKFKGDDDEAHLSIAANFESNVAPKWLEVNKEAVTVKVVALPAREDIDFDFNEQLIVELYSK